MGGKTIKSFLLALQFLTIITVLPDLRADREQLAGSISYFPVVGLILGSLVAGMDWAVNDFWNPLLRGTAIVVLLAFLTRGLHLDGLSDTADAVGSGASRQKALLIMKDSHSGALGILAMVSALLLKTASAVGLSEAGAWQALILIPCLSRWSLNCLGASSTYAREEGGLGTAFCGKPARRHLLVPGLTAAAASWFLLGDRGLGFFALSTAAGPISALWCNQRFGGVTGDILGAHLESIETLLFMLGAGIFTWIQ